MPARLTAAAILRQLQLEELPFEGGHFRQTYVASDQVQKEHLPERYSENKPFSTAILFLLTPLGFSALHKLPTDEVFHYYLGDPAELVELLPDGSSRKIILGPDIIHGQVVQHVVRAGFWQGTHLIPGGEWTLLGTTMAPGYTQPDFELASAARLIEMYPAEADLIRQLTRET